VGGKVFLFFFTAKRFTAKLNGENNVNENPGVKPVGNIAFDSLSSLISKIKVPFVCFLKFHKPAMDCDVDNVHMVC